MKAKTIIIQALATFAFLLCISSALAGDIIISQVLYDPLNSDTYGEAVELYNPTDNIIDISNYIIKTSSYEKDATIPANTFIQPKSYFLITDANFANYKDNESFPNPDYQESITLSNTNAGVALTFNNQTIDAVGWGNSSIISPTLFETAPALHVREGKSLARISLQDTDNNLNDFIETTPIFHNSTSLIQQQNQTYENETSQNETESGLINMTLDINNTAPKILSYSFSEDIFQEKAGYQILPLPGNNKTVLLTVLLSEKDGFSDINEVTAEFNSKQLEYNIVQVNDTSFNISFELELPYYLEPKNYTIPVEIKDSSNESSQIAAEFEYLPVLSLEIDANSLNFNENNSIITGDFLTSTKDKPTILNTGNTPISIGLSAENFTSGSSILPASILSYSFDQSQAFPNIMANSLHIHELSIEPADTLPLGFKITIPSTAVKGSYATKVLVAGVSQ